MDSQDRVLFVVGGGLEAVPGILRAQRMGLHVLVSDRNPQAPGCIHADSCIVADTYDVAGTVAAARRFVAEARPINGVICIATDVPLTVAAVAEALGLAGIGLETAGRTADKLAMKDKFAQDGVPIPWYAPVPSLAELRKLVNGRGYPLVLKPVDSRGARGVLRLVPEVDLEWAFQFSRSFSPTARVMLEEFLAGSQVSTESLVVSGRVHTLGFADRNYELLRRFAPHMIEDGGELPSQLPDEQQMRVRAVVEAAAASLGVAQGVVKGDIVVVDGRPYVIEMAARLSGGYFCTHEIPMNTGVDFVGQAIRLALGETPPEGDLQPTRNRPLCQRYLFPSPGRVVEIEGVEEVSSRAGIEICEIRVTLGDFIGPIDSHPARAGVILASGESAQEAKERALRAVQGIRIATVP